MDKRTTWKRRQRVYIDCLGCHLPHSSDDDCDEFDDDNGVCFKPLFNVDALYFFVNNKLNNSAKIKDYFEDSIFSNTALRDECLLIAVFVHHFFFKQPNNFSRKTKQKDWLGNVAREKLVNSSRPRALSCGLLTCSHAVIC